MESRIYMKGIVRCAARNGTSEFGDAYVNVFQAFDRGFFTGFSFIFVLETKILGVRIIADFAAVLAIGAYVPSAGP